MKIRIYKTTGDKFRLMATEKSLVLGVSTELATVPLAIGLAADFMQSPVVTVNQEGNMFVPKYSGEHGNILFVKTTTSEGANVIAGLAASGQHQLNDSVREDWDASLMASRERIASKAAGALRRFKAGKTALDMLVYGAVKCVLTYLPTEENTEISTTTDETAFAQVIAAGQVPMV